MRAAMQMELHYNKYKQNVLSKKPVETKTKSFAHRTRTGWEMKVNDKWGEGER